jgi:hypothetical protein
LAHEQPGLRVGEKATSCCRCEALIEPAYRLDDPKDHGGIFRIAGRHRRKQSPPSRSDYPSVPRLAGLHQSLEGRLSITTPIVRVITTLRRFCKQNICRKPVGHHPPTILHPVHDFSLSLLATQLRDTSSCPSASAVMRRKPRGWNAQTAKSKSGSAFDSLEQLLEPRSSCRLGIKGSYFCDQDCFKKSCKLRCSWSVHQLTGRVLAQAHPQHRANRSTSRGGQQVDPLEA